ncbi:hypothetical protein [Sphingomonas parapaucimobilis]|uniref:Uncharacterized protein n=1 Tax=Sphingomonas parapaucimobilis NBRC 15100 TaxID=1219049 RepID=A0A0A1W5V2_9SPHN|nr:hypothetical protein [Sphingomonas parapaucimobilis]GAM00531.1 hypothetical protein SP5_034_01050 [Sphingomonas parapaucimobilis NBRC 15100]
MKTIAPSSLHEMSCRCSDCRPTTSSADNQLSLNTMAMITIAGLIVGLILAELVDWWISGPGVIPELGL